MRIVNSGPSRRPAGRAKIRSRLDVTAYFLHEHAWENKKEGVCDIAVQVAPTRFIGMNSIVADLVSDQTGWQAVCNGDDTEINRKDCAAVFRSEFETRNASASPKPE